VKLFQAYSTSLGNPINSTGIVDIRTWRALGLNLGGTTSGKGDSASSPATPTTDNHYQEKLGEEYAKDAASRLVQQPYYDFSGGRAEGPIYTSHADLVKSINYIDSNFSNELTAFKNIYQQHLDEYMKIASATGIPPELIAAIHYRESTADFNTYLHNGDPLGVPTTNVPVGKMFNNFTDAAIDALNDKAWLRDVLNLSASSNDIVGMMAFAEVYNGTGYRDFREMNTPYVFSGTNLYSTGKYVGDGRFSSSAIDSQPGVYILLMALHD